MCLIKEEEVLGLTCVTELYHEARPRKGAPPATKYFCAFCEKPFTPRLLTALKRKALKMCRSCKVPHKIHKLDPDGSMPPLQRLLYCSCKCNCRHRPLPPSYGQDPLDLDFEPETVEHEWVIYDSDGEARPIHEFPQQKSVIARLEEGEILPQPSSAAASCYEDYVTSGTYEERRPIATASKTHDWFMSDPETTRIFRRFHNDYDRHTNNFHYRVGYDVPEKPLIPQFHRARSPFRRFRHDVSGRGYRSRSRSIRRNDAGNDYRRRSSDSLRTWSRSMAHGQRPSWSSDSSTYSQYVRNVNYTRDEAGLSDEDRIQFDTLDVSSL